MRRILGWMSVMILAAATLSWAQSVAQPAQTSAPSSSATNPQATEQGSGTPLEPDTHPLGGAYLSTLGTAIEGRNYLQPEFSIGEYGTNNANFGIGSSNGWVFALLPEANLTLVHSSRRNELSLNYLGGGYVYENSRYSRYDASFHTLGVSDAIQFRRLTLSVGDFFMYLPGGSFGFGGVGGLGGIGGLGSSLYSLPGSGGIGGVNPIFLPNQSILTSQIGTYNNTALLQAQYLLSARTAVTGAASYGTLQAGTPQSGFLSENNAMLSGGVQHSLNPKDTLGASYDFMTFHYVGRPESFNANSVNLNYGRKVTGRLALELSGGPEVVRQRAGLLSNTQVLASGFGDLTYALGRDSLSLTGMRYASGGSGILAGATTDLISGGWSRRWTRMWSSSFTTGYSRNSGLALSGASNHYQYWYTSLEIKRTLGRYVSAYASYSYQRQVANTGTCRTSVCAENSALEYVGVGLIFTPRPVGL